MSGNTRQRQEKIREDLVEDLESRLPTLMVEPLDERLKEASLSMGYGCFGNGKCGKTNINKIIARNLMKIPRVQVKIFDKVQNWVHDFEDIIYQDLDPSFVNEAGSIARETYFESDHILFNAKFYHPNEMKRLLSAIVARDYELHWRYKERGILNSWIIYFIEESHNVLGTIGTNDIWNTFISEGRNLNLSFVFIARRMAQLSAKARENVQAYLWGRMMGELDQSRVKRGSNKEIMQMLPTLGRGEFIFWDGIEGLKIVDTPKYVAGGKPRKWNP